MRSATTRTGVERRQPPRARRRRRAATGLLVLVLAAGLAWALGAALAPGRSCPPFGDSGRERWPVACWRPYSDASPFNTALPEHPRLHPRSRAIAARTAGMGAPGNVAAVAPTRRWDYGKPAYYARAGDPVLTLDCTGRGTGSEGYCEPGLDGQRIRVPRAARPAAGGDGHLTVVDFASGWEHDFWQVERRPARGGVLRFAGGGRTRIDGDGLGSGGAAARFGGLAGVVRAQELAAGRIEHALFMVVPCARGFVYPAAGRARQCRRARDAPAVGQRFQLDMSEAEIDSSPFPPWKKTILRAMARYGMYVGDTGGVQYAQLESPTMYASHGVGNPLAAFARRQPGSRRWTDRNGDRHHVLGDLGAGIDWGRRLRVIDPCVARRTC